MHVDWSTSKAVGQSGGLLILWRVGCTNHIFSFKGKGYLGTKVSWRDHYYYIMNVYSSHNIGNKRRIWSEIKDLKSKFIDGEWYVSRD